MRTGGGQVASSLVDSPARLRHCAGMNQNIPHIAPQGVEPLPRLFYGWRVVDFVFVIMTFASGLGFYNISVILSALTREQGFSVSLWIWRRLRLRIRRIGIASIRRAVS